MRRKSEEMSVREVPLSSPTAWRTLRFRMLNAAVGEEENVRAVHEREVAVDAAMVHGRTGSGELRFAVRICKHEAIDFVLCLF